MDMKNRITFGVFSDTTGNTPILISDDEDRLKDFCYSQNKDLYPKKIMIFSPLYCFIRKVEVNYKGDLVRIIEKWKDRKVEKTENIKNVEEE